MVDLKNWKTSLFAVLATLANVPVLINALWDWADNKPVNWKFVCVSIAITFLSWAAHQSKDKDTISTLPEVIQATKDENKKELVAALQAQEAAQPAPTDGK